MIDLIVLIVGILIGVTVCYVALDIATLRGWPRGEVPGSTKSWRERRRARIARLDLKRALARGRQ